MKAIEITTERLILRQPVMADVPIINRALNEVWNELQKWMVWSYDGQQTMEATENFVRTLGPDSLIGLCRDSGVFVVAGGILPTGEADEYATGYWVAKEFLGKGYATEATCAALHYAFDVLGAKKIHIGYLEGNEKSRRIIEKLGFGNETIMRKSFACCLDGTMMDEHEFTLTDKSALPPMSYAVRYPDLS